MGDLLTDALVATTLSEVVAEEPQSPSGQPLPPPKDRQTAPAVAAHGESLNAAAATDDGDETT